MVAYNTSFILKSSSQELNMQNLINIRPTIVQERSIKEVACSLINQRLNFHELLKKMQNMFRILENVTSYYFEQFLSMKERKMLVENLVAAKET
mmetsp:Transcript_35240/g.26286  ORF Transcript_35240/g.26286 Transcript_35240/m.26286 type:complete len:94 (-) Transcript_35240:1464-1745(-)